MDLVCMECGKKFKSRSDEPQCPRCGGYDTEPAYERCFPSAQITKLRLQALENRR